METTYRFDDSLGVHRIGLGTMRMADEPGRRRGMTAPIWGAPTDRDDLIAFLRGAAKAGVDHFDTADAYALGAGEELLAEALAPYRDRVLIATKIGNTRPSPGEWVPGTGMAARAWQPHTPDPRNHSPGPSARQSLGDVGAPDGR